MPPHILAVFNQLFEELRSMKQQQWTITNYGALILAAIYAVKLPGVSHSQTYMKVLAFVIAIVGSGLLLRVQHNMVGVRLRLDEIDKTYFTPNERVDIGLTDKEINKLQDKRCQRRSAHWRRGLEFTVPLIAVLWGGAVLVCLAL